VRRDAPVPGGETRREPPRGVRPPARRRGAGRIARGLLRRAGLHAVEEGAARGRRARRDGGRPAGVRPGAEGRREGGVSLFGAAVTTTATQRRRPGPSRLGPPAPRSGRAAATSPRGRPRRRPSTRFSPRPQRPAAPASTSSALRGARSRPSRSPSSQRCREGRASRRPFRARARSRGAPSSRSSSRTRESKSSRTRASASTSRRPRSAIPRRDGSSTRCSRPTSTAPASTPTTSRGRPRPPRTRPVDGPLAKGRRRERRLRDGGRALDRGRPCLPRPARPSPARTLRGAPAAPLGAPRLARGLRGDGAAARPGPGADGAGGDRRRPGGTLGPLRRPRCPPRGPRDGDPRGCGRAVQRRLPTAARANPLREAGLPRPEEDGEDEELRDRLGGPRGARKQGLPASLPGSSSSGGSSRS
jgi:hypothetical protein